MKLIVILCSIIIVLSWPVDSRKCYYCSCNYDWGTNSGTCNSTTFLSNCVLQEVGNSYCNIISLYSGNVESRIFESLAPDTFQDSHFIQAVETIALSGATWLPTNINSISYGCAWDGCNDINLAQYLPESFQMKISQTILNSVLINGQLPAESCYTCSKCINDLTATLCKQVSCSNGICAIDEIHNYIVTPANNCTYNFASYCQPLTQPAQVPNVRIRATYYIDFPQERQIAIDEVDILCTKDYCNSIDIVENLKGQVQAVVNLHPDFQPSRPNDTMTSTTGSSTSTLTTTRGPVPTTASQGMTSSATTSQAQASTTTTATAHGSKSAQSYSVVFLFLILILSLL